MALSIRPINPRRDDFVADVTGVDIAAGVSPELAAEIEDAMDRYAVLVLPDQRIDDDQQYALSTNFGPMETATGDIAQVTDRRLSMDINDISNLDKDGKVLPRDDRRASSRLAFQALGFQGFVPLAKRERRPARRRRGRRPPARGAVGAAISPVRRRRRRRRR